MEEHIFGTYATEELKVSHHRAMRRGVQQAVTRHRSQAARPAHPVVQLRLAAIERDEFEAAMAGHQKTRRGLVAVAAVMVAVVERVKI